jgi:hypothetical protein
MSFNSNVTLIYFEGVKSKHEEGKVIFNYLKNLLKIDNAIFVGLDVNYNEALFWELGDALDYFSTSHMLRCTWDGFVMNPHLWDDRWLNYDMIGAPWPKICGFNNQVGNTGFTLQSRYFLETAKKHKSKYIYSTPGDVWLCQIMFETFKAEGIKYASVSEAAKFSWESYIETGEAGPDKSFGFHGFGVERSKEHYYDSILKKAELGLV